MNAKKPSDSISFLWLTCSRRVRSWNWLWACLRTLISVLYNLQPPLTTTPQQPTANNHRDYPPFGHLCQLIYIEIHHNPQLTFPRPQNRT
ncbi:hypothetical protein SLEP1_g25958 [Rubroshorea leprosula]|uniref:Uncharacterized protein n=1 Tax=Rubroshorea leprosula TaxID=152421 RepID=A0AAV5JR24_9ROSI|nr:hypothetical protein SLEP1_g25958 [Rubroshorea leprosula]